MTSSPTGSTDAASAPQGALAHLDPHHVVLEDNVRDVADLDADFLASVREHGVLQPVTAIRVGEDVRVRDGQRRTLAAREVGLSTVPVYILDTSAPSGRTATAERIAHQIVANDQRRALTDGQRARGIQQMLDSGLSQTKVAQKLSVSRDTVTAARRAAASPAALDALDHGQLSLTEAAALTEFEDDPAAVASLLITSGPMFEHRVAQLRQDRLAEAAREQTATDYAHQGYTVLTERPQWRDTTIVALHHLRTPDGHTADEHAVTDPSHWAVLLIETSVVTDRQTGEVVASADVDWLTQGQPDRRPRDGYRHADSVEDTAVWEPEYYCLDPAGAGLTVADFLTRQNRPAVDDDAGDDAARAEAERAQRRKVLALNKLGVAAQEVRRRFVQDTLLSRKTPVKGAAVFVTTCLEQGPGLLAEYGGRQLIGELTGLKDDFGQTIGGLTASADGRAHVLLLAMVLAGLEHRTPKDAWRGSAPGSHTPSPGPAEYLRFLAAHGYTLSPIEEVVVGDRTADDVHQATQTAD